MTTQQDKELSSEVALVAKYALEYIDALPKDIELPTMPGFDRDWADAVMDKLKRAPQLPVAEKFLEQSARLVDRIYALVVGVTNDQPSAQVITDDIMLELKRSRFQVAEQPAGQAVPVAWLYESESCGVDLVRKPFCDEVLAMCPEDMTVTPLYAAPHSPVAQMSGEPFCVDCGDQIMAHNPGTCGTCHSIKYENASHPSNAAIAEEYTRGRADGWDAAKLKYQSAATVPPVVQAPSINFCAPFPGMDEPWSEEKIAEFAAALDKYDDAAPQPIDASPSIVPSDEQIMLVARKYGCGAAVQGAAKDDLLRYSRELLTTTSNAGEAAQGEKS